MARRFGSVSHAAVKRLKQSTCGQELVEFALVLPLLLLLLYGILEMGRAVYTYNIMANIAREGARYGIIHADPHGSGNCGAPPAGIGVAACEIIVGLTPAEVRITPTVTSETVQVTVNYDFNFLTGLVIQAVGGNPVLALSAQATMQREQY